MKTKLLRHFYHVIVLIALSASVGVLADPQYNSTSTTKPVTQDEAKLVEHGHYKNTDGKTVHSPAHTKDGSIPSGATAECRDGSYSFSQHHRGTCSHHGGVSQWL